MAGGPLLRPVGAALLLAAGALAIASISSAHRGWKWFGFAALSVLAVCLGWHYLKKDTQWLLRILIATSLAVLAGLLSASLGYVAGADQGSTWFGTGVTLGTVFFLAALGFAPAKAQDVESWLALAPTFVLWCTARLGAAIISLGAIAVLNVLTFVYLPHSLYTAVVRCYGGPGAVEWTNFTGASEFRECRDPLVVRMWQPVRGYEESLATIRCVQPGEEGFPSRSPERWAPGEVHCRFLDPADSILKQFESDDASEREAAARVLGSRAPEVVAASAVNGLRRLLPDYKNPKVQLAAVVALGRFGKRARSATAELLDLLGQRPEVKEGTVKTFLGLGSEAATALVSVGMNEQHYDAIAKGILDLHNPLRTTDAVIAARGADLTLRARLLGPLVDRLNREREPAVLMELLRTLGTAGSGAEAALPRILELSSDAHKELSKAARETEQRLRSLSR